MIILTLLLAALLLGITWYCYMLRTLLRKTKDSLAIEKSELSRQLSQPPFIIERKPSVDLRAVLEFPMSPENRPPAFYIKRKLGDMLIEEMLSKGMVVFTEMDSYDDRYRLSAKITIVNPR